MSQVDRLLGVLFRKACSSSSWRTRRSGGERWAGRMVSAGAEGPPLLYPVIQVRFQGHPRANCQEEGTVAQQLWGPTAGYVWIQWRLWVASEV